MSATTNGKLRLAIVTAHAGADSIRQALNSWGRYTEWVAYPDADTALHMDHGPEDMVTFVLWGGDGMLPAYQRGFEKACKRKFDVVAFLHDDTIIHESGWADRVLKEFEDPAVGLVGFGGALGHGSSRLYVDEYDYHQLGRDHFMSNMTDAENHGARFEGTCDVAVLDGFALIVRRELLERAGGWPLTVQHNWTVHGMAINAQTGEPCESPVAVCTRCRYRIDSPNVPPCPSPIGYVCYDYWLCCMAHRLGYRIRLVGCSTTHYGGRTFVKLGIGRDPKHWEQYINSHRYIYDEFRDVLPFHVAFPVARSTR